MNAVNSSGVLPTAIAAESAMRPWISGGLRIFAIEARVTLSRRAPP